MVQKVDPTVPVGSPEAMRLLGWKWLDVLLLCGDAYVDHPSFGIAVVARWLQSLGLRVGVLSQPSGDLGQIAAFGMPRLFVGISAGNLDSMVSNYTASRKPRRRDDYTPGGAGGKRPNRATIVYANWVRSVFKDVPLVLGGIEASLRRFAHYDWWTNRIRHSVLMDARADFIFTGMAERTLEQAVPFFQDGSWKKNVPLLPGVVSRVAKGEEIPGNPVFLPSFSEVSSDPEEYARSVRLLYRENDPIRGKSLVQADGASYVLQTPPPHPLNTAELDRVYALPFTRAVHPELQDAGDVKALETVRFSINSHRGCYGGCSFCSIALHQGQWVRWRSVSSVVQEAQKIQALPGFRGYISDVGGPTANMYGFECEKKLRLGSCVDRNCLFPTVCPSLKPTHKPYLHLLSRLLELPGIQGVFVSSGIRHDLVLADPQHGDAFLQQLAAKHVSGQLKLAPEHSSEKVTNLMAKPPASLFLEFQKRFEKASKAAGKKQFVVCYFMVGHPGEDARENQHLRQWIPEHLGYFPQQVQVFTPTPSTLSTAMYHAGVHPFSGEGVFCTHSDKERQLFKSHIVSLREDVKHENHASPGQRKARKGSVAKGGARSRNHSGK